MPMPPQRSNQFVGGYLKRIRVWYVFLVLIIAIFVVRLFYLQIIKYDYYKNAALNKQVKQYEIPAKRGIIEARAGNQTLPVVLNESRYTLFADPKFIKDPASTADKIVRIIGGKAETYEKLMKADSRYAVLAKKLEKSKKQQLDKLDIKGLGTREEPVRTYPQGELASQLLGFVNDEGAGKYGIEQYLNSTLAGKPGQLKAITDAQGVPLVANKDNIVTEPESGSRVVLTIDVSIQKQLEDILKTGLGRAKSKSGSALIMNPKNGAVVAMANYPTYNPAEFYKVEDANIFNNSTVSSPLEIGSTMKPLTAAAALDQGVVNRNTTYYDPSELVIDTAKITNIEEDGGPGTRSIADILQLSLNTGAVYLLKQMGGGEVNQKARTAWYDYMTNHYRFGKLTGIEQGYESEGYIPNPVNGYGLNIQYANTAFGQGLSITTLQLASALSGIINGGTYYQPHLVDEIITPAGKHQKKQPKALSKVISTNVSNDIKDLMSYVYQKNHVLYGMPNLRSQYLIGGKTGTAEITKPGGGYYEDKFNGTFIGFVGGNEPEYVIVVRVDEPKISGYAGAKAAAPLFTDLVNMLIDNFGIAPKG